MVDNIKLAIEEFIWYIQDLFDPWGAPKRYKERLDSAGERLDKAELELNKLYLEIEKRKLNGK